MSLSPPSLSTAAASRSSPPPMMIPARRSPATDQVDLLSFGELSDIVALLCTRTDRLLASVWLQTLVRGDPDAAEFLWTERSRNGGATLLPFLDYWLLIEAAFLDDRFADRLHAHWPAVVQHAIPVWAATLEHDRFLLGFHRMVFVLHAFGAAPDRRPEVHWDRLELLLHLDILPTVAADAWYERIGSLTPDLARELQRRKLLDPFPHPAWFRMLAPDEAGDRGRLQLVRMWIRKIVFWKHLDSTASRLRLHAWMEENATLRLPVLRLMLDECPLEPLRLFPDEADELVDLLLAEGAQRRAHLRLLDWLRNGSLVPRRLAAPVRVRAVSFLLDRAQSLLPEIAQAADEALQLLQASW